MTKPEPFLRWAGGKRQLLGTLLAALPADFDLAVNRFYEPFVGGGAVSLALASDLSGEELASAKGARKALVLNDVNDDLMNVYRVVVSDVEGLIKRLRRLERDTSSEAYYAMRAKEPTSDLARAARTIFLNKLSFNGLHRVRGDGKFNVPYGKVAKASLFDGDLLRAVSRWLKHAELRSGSYSAALVGAQLGDVVYLDPPYIPLSATASFSKYAKDDFRELEQWALAGVVEGLSQRGVRVIFSNSNTELTRRIFGRELNLYEVSASRSISAAGASRVRVHEVVGINYPSRGARDPKVLGNLKKLTSKKK